MTNLPTLPCLNGNVNTSEGLVREYFQRSFTYLEIKEFLDVKHGIKISLSTIKRWLRKMGLYRRALIHRRTSSLIVQNAVQNQLQGSGGNLGYRRIWAHLVRQGIIARKEDIRKYILQLDPSGVDLRRRGRLRRRKYRNNGPNSTWHLDGHDKLKPFGFSIHGCIDGYSRRLIWLEVASTNKRPELVARYYLDAVKQLKGVPKTLKADDGTEHSLIEPIHICLRDPSAGNNAAASFSIVSSPVNQRIESYWSKLRKDRPGWWKAFFEDLMDLELFDADDPVLVDCLRFCFMHIIREELNSVANEWNQHLISKSLNGGPSGRPDTMFFLPHLFNASNNLQNADVDEVDEFYTTISGMSTPLDYSNEFKEFSETVMTMHNVQMSSDAETGLNLYMFLSRQIKQYS